MSNRKFSIMQMPKNVEFMKLLIADSGHVLVYTDISALEPHVLAHFSRDPGLMGLYGPGARPTDVYLHVGSQTDKWGPVISKWFDYRNPTLDSIKAAKRHCRAERDEIKPVYLGWSYGLGATTMSAGTGLSIPICKAILKNIDEAFPGTVEFSSGLRSQWRDNGGWAKVEWVQQEDGRSLPNTIDGRPGWILNGRNRPLGVAPEKAKDLLNRFVQSTGHDVELELLCIINKLRKERKVPMRPFHVDLHDSTVWQVSADHEDAAIAVFTDAYDLLNKALGWTVKISGAIKTGETLADFLEE